MNWSAIAVASFRRALVIQDRVEQEVAVAESRREWVPDLNAPGE